MPRLCDATKRHSAQRLNQWKFAMRTLAKRRVLRRQNPSASATSLALCAKFYSSAQGDVAHLLDRRNRISLASFCLNFNGFSDADCLSHFRFNKEHVIKMKDTLSWPVAKTLTKRNRYAVSAILSTCVIFRRLASPTRWRDLEEMFGKHASALSEIFWEGIEHFVDARGRLLTGFIQSEYMQTNLERYASAVHKKSSCLENCVGFIDGTVLGIARPSGAMAQLSAYNGHKRKHVLKYQAVNTPDGIVAHMYGPLEGRRHDWTLYVKSNLEQILPQLLEVEEKRYCIFGDSGYSRRWFLEVPYQGSNMSPAQVAFNKAMSGVRITVEWVFKEVKLYFPTMDYKRKLKVLEAPVGMLYTSCMLLCNMRNCIYPNQISKFFDCTPPTLEEYLSQAE